MSRFQSVQFSLLFVVLFAMERSVFFVFSASNLIPLFANFTYINSIEKYIPQYCHGVESNLQECGQAVYLKELKSLDVKYNQINQENSKSTVINNVTESKLSYQTLFEDYILKKRPFKNSFQYLNEVNLNESTINFILLNCPRNAIFDGFSIEACKSQLKASDTALSIDIPFIATNSLFRYLQQWQLHHKLNFELSSNDYSNLLNTWPLLHIFNQQNKTTKIYQCPDSMHLVVWLLGSGNIVEEMKFRVISQSHSYLLRPTFARRSLPEDQNTVNGQYSMLHSDPPPHFATFQQSLTNSHQQFFEELSLDFNEYMFIPSGYILQFERGQESNVNGVIFQCLVDASNYQDFYSDLRIHSKVSPSDKRMLQTLDNFNMHHDSSGLESSVTAMTKVMKRYPSQLSIQTYYDLPTNQNASNPVMVTNPEPDPVAQSAKATTNRRGRRRGAGVKKDAQIDATASNSFREWQDDNKWNRIIIAKTLPKLHPPMMEPVGSEVMSISVTNQSLVQRVHRDNVTLNWHSAFIPHSSDRTVFGFKVKICPLLTPSNEDQRRWLVDRIINDVVYKNSLSLLQQTVEGEKMNYLDSPYYSSTTRLIPCMTVDSFRGIPSVSHFKSIRNITKAIELNVLDPKQSGPQGMLLKEIQVEAELKHVSHSDSESLDNRFPTIQSSAQTQFSLIIKNLLPDTHYEANVAVCYDRSVASNTIFCGEPSDWSTPFHTSPMTTPSPILPPYIHRIRKVNYSEKALNDAVGMTSSMKEKLKTKTEEIVTIYPFSLRAVMASSENNMPSIELQFTWPHDDGGSPILGFHVYCQRWMKLLGTPTKLAYLHDWKLLTTIDVKDVQYYSTPLQLKSSIEMEENESTFPIENCPYLMMRNLRPGSSYVFKVVPYNMLGYNYESPILSPIIQYDPKITVGTIPTELSSVDRMSINSAPPSLRTGTVTLTFADKSNQQFSIKTSSHNLQIVSNIMTGSVRVIRGIDDGDFSVEGQFKFGSDAKPFIILDDKNQELHLLCKQSSVTQQLFTNASDSSTGFSINEIVFEVTTYPVWRAHWSPQHYAVIGRMKFIENNKIQNEIANSIGIVERGGSYLYEKIGRIQAAGALAAVIVDNGVCDDYDQSCIPGANKWLQEGFGKADIPGYWENLKLPTVFILKHLHEDLVQKMQGDSPISFKAISLHDEFVTSFTLLYSKGINTSPLRSPLRSTEPTFTPGPQSEITTSTTGGEATITTSTFNLAKSIIGAGVLSLPSGVAFFADETTALVPASILCTVFGLMAAYSFSLIGKICKEYEATSFQDAWGKSVNPNTAKFISIAITSLCFLASLAYSIMIGDSFSALFQTFNLPSLLTNRVNVILLFTSMILFPLCSLQNLNALAPFSLLGLGGTLYTAAFMAIRFFDGSYKVGGKFFNSIPSLPVFNQRGGYALNHLTFVLVSMLSTSYIAHYNAPQFYNELKNNTMARFNQVVGGGFLSAIALCLFIMSIGFLTFGGSSLGFILNNYSGSDVLATGARLAIGLALLTGYPFTFSALRDGVLDLRKLSGTKRLEARKTTTIIGLSLITFLALILKDVGFVVSISGAMFGCFLMFIVPAVMNLSHMKNLVSKTKSQFSTMMKFESAVNYVMIVLGVLMTIIGVAVSTLKQIGKL